MVWVSGLRIHLYGPLPKAGQSFLLLSNHVSYWDILALGSLFPLGFMAKDRIASWPILGTITSLCNTIYVNRDDVAMRVGSLRTLQKNIRSLPYCVFPEATTTAALAPEAKLWHRGNIAVLRDPGVRVWLAGLHYKQQKEQAWIADDALLPHLFQAMQAPSIELIIQLQALAVDQALPLADASLAALWQMTQLCHKAQEKGEAIAKSCSLSLYKNTDSAVR
jgi:1-acyl-sn-glycerol-3-phosphate acyltransferase